MYIIGIDCGTQRTKGVLLQDREIVATAMALTAFNAAEAAENVKKQLLEQARVKEEDVGMSVTGIGKDQIPGAANRVNDITAAAQGALFLAPETRCLIDLGAESSKAIRLHPDGLIAGYEVNDKCASGTGTFIEAMARVLNLSVDEFGPVSMKHKKVIPISAQCVVFVESEVISLVHQRESVEDIAYGVLGGVSSRIGAMVGQLGAVESITVIGGPTRNAGFMDCLERELKQPVRVPQYAVYAGAIGAALYGYLHEVK